MKLYSFNRRKIYFMCIALVMAAVLLMGRLAYLMVAKADYYDSAATQLHERERSIMIHALNDYQSRQCAGQKGSRGGKETG